MSQYYMPSSGDTSRINIGFDYEGTVRVFRRAICLGVDSFTTFKVPWSIDKGGTVYVVTTGPRVIYVGTNLADCRRVAENNTQCFSPHYFEVVVE
jgi:hypothetical protein